MFMKIKKVVKAFSILILFIWLGFYILRISESLLGDMIGFANIGFFNALLVWAIFKIWKEKTTE